MRKKISYFQLVSILLLAIFVGVWILSKDQIKAAVIKPHDFQLSAKTVWDEEQQRNYMELSWLTDEKQLESDYKITAGITSDALTDQTNKIEKFESVESETDQAFRNTAKVDATTIDRRPSQPEVTIKEQNEQQTVVEITAEDESITTYWQVKNTKTVKQSDVIDEQWKTTVKGFVYIVDQAAETQPEIIRDSRNAVTNLTAQKNEKLLTINSEGRTEQWLHILAVSEDNKISDTTHIQLNQKKTLSRAVALPSDFSFDIERTQDTAKLVDIIIGAKLDKKMKSFEVKIPKNMTIDNYSTLKLPTSWDKFQNSNDDDGYKSFTFAMNADKTKNTSATIKAFLESLKFKISAPTDQSGHIQIVFHELVYTSWDHPDGENHYYTFVSSGTGSWFDAYNQAKKMNYRGLTGYLATLTSLEEHDFVYNNIAKESGWLGGARLVRSSQAKLKDESSIPTTIGSYNVTTTIAKEWYWVNGPETGTVFFDKPTYNGNGSAGLGKAPAGIYQGFNNVAGGGKGDKVEPNNSGNECVLEFAQASSATPTKLWNDLAPSNTGRGYYVEFSKYGSQIETEDETDVSATHEIPQKLIVTAVDDKNQSLSFGSQVFDQQLRTGQKIQITPPENEQYDFLAIKNQDGQIVSDNVFTVGSKAQQATLIYAKRMLTLNSKAVIIQKNSETVVPKASFSTLTSYSTANQTSAQYQLKMPATTDNTLAFDKATLRYQIAEPLFKLTTNIPENYQLVGYAVTTENSNHTVESSVREPELLDATKASEYWITVFLTPVSDNPTSYHWAYQENTFGKISVN